MFHIMFMGVSSVYPTCVIIKNWCRKRINPVQRYIKFNFDKPRHFLFSGEAHFWWLQKTPPGGIFHVFLLFGTFGQLLVKVKLCINTEIFCLSWTLCAYSVNICIKRMCVSLDGLWNVFWLRSVYILDIRSREMRIAFCRLGFTIKGDKVMGSERKSWLYLAYICIKQIYVSVDVL